MAAEIHVLWISRFIVERFAIRAGDDIDVSNPLELALLWA
jgi:hypothetical protein